MMKTIDELQHLSLEELYEAHVLLFKCLQILNPDDMGLCDLCNDGRDMTFKLELAKITIFSRIIELEKEEFEKKKKINENTSNL